MPIEKLKPTFSIDRESLNALKQITPEAFVDGKVNWETLKEALGEYLEDDSSNAEPFGLFWPGKRDARKLTSLPSKGSLVPVLGEGVDEATTENIFIEGDNLEVLKLLQKSYAGRIKMIYIDPPYNTGNDFIYKDTFADSIEDYLKKTGQADEEGKLLTTNVKTEGRFHSNWLNMMYPRLRLARNLLREDGIIFVSIDDNEVHNLHHIMNEIFGEENFISQIIIQSNKRGQTYKEIAKTHEYLLIYSSSDNYTMGELEKADDSLPYEDTIGKYDLWELRNRNPKFGRFNRPNLYYPIYIDAKTIDKKGHAKISLTQSNDYSIESFPKNSEGQDSCWRWGKDKVNKAIKEGTEELILVAKQKRNGEWNIYEKARKSTTKAKSIWDETDVISEQGTVELGNLGIGKLFDHPKPVALIKKALKIGTELDDIVLDFFAGSGTTSQALMELNNEDGGKRKFICVQLPEVTPKESEARKAGYERISDITKERIRRAIQKIKNKSSNESPLLKISDNSIMQDLGFKVYKLHKSNFKTWQDYKGEHLEQIQTLFSAFESPLIDNWKEENLIAEVMVLEGFPLNASITQVEKFRRNKMYCIESDFCAHKLYICLDSEIWENTIEKIVELPKEDIFICLDSAVTDEAKLNLANVCSIKTI